uniref:Uncharacterized protein n=1 Tax=Minutocellus polymorphus TaxID=265543 RepID=A0A7S0ASS1_9STRA|mmetsp:Transcript_337/g.586  ORF Transcript_337/g.586 Transcript_337/m.586 type:complete len:154 (+) Transcript_337:56-517(+)
MYDRTSCGVLRWAASSSRRQCADLFTVSGANKLVGVLAVASQNDDANKGNVRVRPFDHVFFTVGCWPNYSDPYTADGVEKVVALDLLARHTVLTGLIRHKLLNTGKDTGARIISTLARHNHLCRGRRAHDAALDDDLAAFVLDWLEKTCGRTA